MAVKWSFEDLIGFLVESIMEKSDTYETTTGYKLVCSREPLDNRFPHRVYVLAPTRADFVAAMGEDIVKMFKHFFYSDGYEDGVPVCGIPYKIVWVRKVEAPK